MMFIYVVLAQGPVIINGPPPCSHYKNASSCYNTEGYNCAWCNTHSFCGFYSPCLRSMEQCDTNYTLSKNQSSCIGSYIIMFIILAVILVGAVVLTIYWCKEHYGVTVCFSILFILLTLALMIVSIVLSIVGASTHNQTLELVGMNLVIYYTLLIVCMIVLAVVIWSCGCLSQKYCCKNNGNYEYL